MKQEAESESPASFTIMDPKMERAMKLVNWRAVSLVESRSLGVSLNVLQDAEIQRLRSEGIDSYMRWIVLTSLTVTVGGKVLHFEPIIITFGVVAVLLAALAGSKLMLWAARTNSRVQRRTILEEIYELMLSHPVQENVDDTLPLEVVEDPVKEA